MSPGPTFADRLWSLAQALGYQRPSKSTAHAWARWRQRWNNGPPGQARLAFRALFAAAVITGLDDRKGVSYWRAGEVDLVVGKDGTVVTVLPLGAQRRRAT